MDTARGDEHGDVEPERPTRGGRRRTRLPGGGELVVRPVRPDDVDGLVALCESLSDDDRYRRFFSGYHPDRAFFERAASVVDRGGYGLVAVVPGPDRERLVGEASYELLPDGDGELAMTVAPDWRGWLGPYLLDALVEAAAERGVPNLEADVLATNRAMLSLLRSRGYARLPSDDWVALRLIIGTSGPTPVWPPGDRAGEREGGGRRPRVLVEAIGGQWHAAHEAAAAGLEVITCSGPKGARPRCPALAGRPCPLAAGADAIVMSHAPDSEAWRTVAESHAHLHPGVPVCVELRPGQEVPPEARPVAVPATPDEASPPARSRDHAEDRDAARGREHEDVAVVLPADDARLSVAVVDRLASAHLRAARERRRRDDPEAPTAGDDGP